MSIKGIVVDGQDYLYNYPDLDNKPELTPEAIGAASQSALSDIENMQPITVFNGGTVSGTTFAEAHPNIAEGSYTLNIDSIISSGTDSEYSSIAFYHGSTELSRLFFARNTAISYPITFNQSVDTIYYYAEDQYKSSVGDTFTFTNVRLTGDYPLRKATEKINKYAYIEINMGEASGYYDQNGAFQQYANNIRTAEIEVTEGEKYLLTSNSFYGALRAVFFNGTSYLSGVYSGNNTALNTDTPITVPANATKMLLQTSKYFYTNTVLKKSVDVIPPVSSILKGKSVTVIGDSITEYNFQASKNWAMYLSEWCGVSVQNLGISGTGFAKDQPYINRVSSITGTPDIIGVALSWNDMGVSIPLGTATDTGTSTLAGYANDLFTALQTNYPTTPIICYCQGPWGSFRPGVEKSDNWITLLKDICKLKGIPFYDDLYFGSALHPWITANKNYYYSSDNTFLGSVGTIDDVHPNSIGHEIIARYLYPQFAKNIVAYGMDYNAFVM